MRRNTAAAGASPFTRGATALRFCFPSPTKGPGVKPADLERIFEKFYRGGRSDGRKTGTGLGLSISRGLIEAMGGRIGRKARRRGGAAPASSSPCRPPRRPEIAKAAP